MQGQTIIIILLGLIVAKLYPDWWVYVAIIAALTVISLALKKTASWCINNATFMIYIALGILGSVFIAALLTLLSYVRRLLNNDWPPFFGYFAKTFQRSYEMVMIFFAAGVVLVSIIILCEFIISIMRKNKP